MMWLRTLACVGSHAERGLAAGVMLSRQDATSDQWQTPPLNDRNATRACTATLPLRAGGRRRSDAGGPDALLAEQRRRAWRLRRGLSREQLPARAEIGKRERAERRRARGCERRAGRVILRR